MVPPGPRLTEALEADFVDALIGVVRDAPAGIRKRTLYQDDFVTLMRAGILRRAGSSRWNGSWNWIISSSASPGPGRALAR